MSDSDIRLLRVFLAVAECGGFSAACGTLNVGESTISAQMSALEVRLGVRLCDRGRSGFRLTDEGMAVHRHARRLFCQLEDFREEVRLLKDELGGVLRVGVCEALRNNPQLPLARAVARFLQRPGQARLAMETLSHRAAEQALLEDRVDLAFLPEGQQLSGLHYLPLLEQQCALYCGRGHALFGCPDPALTPEDLQAAVLISATGDEPSDGGAPGAAPVRATVSDAEAALQLILAGDFLGYLPDHVAQPWVEQGELRALGPGLYRRWQRYGAVTSATRSLRSVTRAFLDDLAASTEAKPAARSPLPSVAPQALRNRAQTEFRPALRRVAGHA